MRDRKPEWQAWLSGVIDSLTHEIKQDSPAGWAEKNRYLPLSVTSRPGFFSYSVTPYLREIADHADLRSNVREVYLKKAAQIGATVGILENIIGYCMAVVKSAPVMLVTADAELAQLRTESNITPMIQQSGLSELIRSTDEHNSRKTGKTDKKIEWEGGGYLLPIGARNPNKGRSTSIQYLLLDETSGYPLTIGKDGDPIKIFTARTKGYYQTRKIFALSTPLLKGQSRIDDLYDLGDKRKYQVPCKSCGFKQELRWHGINPENGITYGMKWAKRPDGTLDRDSVKYVCCNCGCEHINEDKVDMLAGGEWVPTATPREPETRSYHISALYSPPSMYPWAAAVQDWLNAWDEESNHPRDLGLMQEFYNNVLGESFAATYDRVPSDTVMGHRRAYIFGMIPNRMARLYSESEILLVTCAVDVHKEFLKVGVVGWTAYGRSYLIDYHTFSGTTADGATSMDNLDNSAWRELEDIIHNREYIADDGKKYRIALTLIDSGYLPDTVIRFCDCFRALVHPVKGQDYPPRSARIKEFNLVEGSMGGKLYGLTVGLYKDRLSAALKREWDGESLQPRGHFNAPENATNRQLLELTAEYKKEKLERGTNRVIGYEWFRPSGAANELWDIMVYNSAALDILAHNACVNHWQLDSVNWVMFWQACERDQLFFT